MLQAESSDGVVVANEQRKQEKERGKSVLVNSRDLQRSRTEKGKQRPLVGRQI
jgi:hypothetical protein